MDEELVLAVKSAADWFVNRADYADLRRALDSALLHKHVVFKDEVWPMNTLLALGRERGSTALAPLLEVTDNLAGYDPNAPVQTDRPPVSFVVPDALSPDANRMAERRARWKKAMRIYRRLTGRKFNSTREEEQFARANFQPLWMSWKHDTIKRAGRISRKQENALTHAFWAKIEEDLDRAQYGDDDLARRLVGLDKPGDGVN